MINLFHKQSFFHHGNRLSTITEKDASGALAKKNQPTLASSFSRNSNVKHSSTNSMRQRAIIKANEGEEEPHKDMWEKIVNAASGLGKAMA